MYKLILFLLSTIIAIYLGFFAFDKKEMFFLYGDYIYYFISVIFFIWLYFIIKTILQDKDKALTFFNYHKLSLIISAILVALFFFICPPEYRILSDETNLLGTSKELYENNKAYINLEEIKIFDKSQVFQKSLDKRFILFPYILQIIHCFKGYSPYNVFIINAFVSFACLFLFYFIIQRLWGKIYGLIALLLLSSYPLFIQYAMSAGYDVFCLFWALFAFVVFCNYFRNNAVQNADLLLYTVALLAYTRYECSIMAIIIVPIMLIILGKNNINKLGYEFIIYPLLFVPIAWIMFFVNTSSYLQLEENEAAFSINYLKDNIFKALYFFCGWDPNQNTVFIIALAASLGLFSAIYKILINKKLFIEKIRQYKFHLMLICFFLLDQAIIKFSYIHGDLTFNLNSRFGITLLPYIIFLAIYFIKIIINKYKVNNLIIFLMILPIFLMHWPNVHKSFVLNSPGSYRVLKIILNYLKDNYNNKERLILALDRPVQLIPFNYNAITIKTFNDNFDEIKNKIKNNKLWNEIIVIQVLENEKLPTDYMVKDDINLEILYESPIRENTYIRFSKVKL